MALELAAEDLPHRGVQPRQVSTACLTLTRTLTQNDDIVPGSCYVPHFLAYLLTQVDPAAFRFAAHPAAEHGGVTVRD